MKINLSDIQKVKDFVAKTQRVAGDVTLQCGRYVVDGKSILGIFSLDLTKPITLLCQDEKDYEIFEEFNWQN